VRLCFTARIPTSSFTEQLLAHLRTFYFVLLKLVCLKPFLT
jgi:hypothetical protein